MYVPVVAVLDTLTAKLNKLTIRVDSLKLSPEDIKKLQAAQRSNKMSE